VVVGYFLPVQTSAWSICGFGHVTARKKTVANGKALETLKGRTFGK